MRNIALLLGMVFMIVSCTTNVDYTMGEEFIPSNQNMELRRRVYLLDECIEGDTKVGCRLVTTRQYKSDSIPTANLTNGYFGCEQSDTYGRRTAGFMSQMLFSLSLPEGRGWGYRPIYDSMLLSLKINDFHGDTTKKHRFNIYEITSNDYLNLPKDKDTAFYANFNPEGYISEEPIFTFEFPNQDKGVYVKGGDGSNIRLESTEATSEYISRLMLTTELDANGGYALDSDGIYVEGNEEKFVERIKGIYIAPADDMEGAMFSTKLENTALLLFARGRYEEDPQIIRDTTYMIYNLYLGKSQYSGKAGNVAINTISHDYEGSAVELDVDNKALCYVEGMAGAVMEVKFTDEFIESLANIVIEAGAEATVSVNQAHISFYMEHSLYDYNDLPIATLTPMMDEAMTRLGLYVDYSTRTAISDYQYSVEGQSVQLSYDGYLNRSLACYKMDISNYVQSLMLTAAKTLEDDGSLEKFEDEYINLRRFYVAPEATSMFGMKRQPLYGMGGEAPIKLELTYTTIK